MRAGRSSTWDFLRMESLGGERGCLPLPLPTRGGGGDVLVEQEWWNLDEALLVCVLKFNY